jgi:ribosomal protein S12 methylthiotransferase
VVVDRLEGPVAIARSYGDAPEIDGQVIVEDPGQVSTGDFIDVEITGCDHYDLFGRRVAETPA